MGYHIFETMTPTLRKQILALIEFRIIELENLCGYARIQEAKGMPAIVKIRYLMQKAKQRQGDGDPLDCQRFRSEIGGALWDHSLPSQYDNVQKWVFLWWMKCEGELKRFAVLPAVLPELKSI